jgi:hypothetical protein
MTTISTLYLLYGSKLADEKRIQKGGGMHFAKISQKCPVVVHMKLAKLGSGSRGHSTYVLSTFLCTGAFLYVNYGFLLVLSMQLWVWGGQCSKKSLLHCAPSLFPKVELWALGAHVHKTTYGPLIDTVWPCT